MSVVSDLSYLFMSRRFQFDLQRKSWSTAQAATSGIVADKARHLGGATLALSLINRKQVRLEQYQKSITEVAMVADVTQSVLGRIQEQIGKFALSLALAPQMQTSPALATIALNAETLLIDTVTALNSKIAGRHLFSGSATQTRPLQNGSEILNMLQSATAGANSANDISTAIDIWFEAPGGPFETDIYAGSVTGFINLPLNYDESATLGFRADDVIARKVLKSLAKAAIAGHSTMSLPSEERALLLDHTRRELLITEQMLIEESSALGLTEARIEDAKKLATQAMSQISSSRLSMIGSDQFTAASEFEATQQQLDVLYRVVSRQSRISLAEYLR